MRDDRFKAMLGCAALTVLACVVAFAVNPVDVLYAFLVLACECLAAVIVTGTVWLIALLIANKPRRYDD